MLKRQRTLGIILHRKLVRNNVEAKIDPETKFKDYYVGTSPTDSTKPYMKISTRSDGNGTYTTGIDYGPFEFIEENF